MFFVDSRAQFFKPLTTKYRAQVAECLCLIHQRLYGAAAEYGQALNRDQVLDIFEEALARSPVLEGEDSEQEQRFKSLREQARWILQILLENGWLDKHVDPASLQTTYPFTRSGRLFAAPLVEAERRISRTRHRNTRNTLNALEAFLSRGEIHDLLDAWDFSERIISDFTDVISELEERKRELVREAETQLLVQQATEQFFDFMEKRFQPDLSVRLTADSVEKHRDRIASVLTKIRRKDKTFKQDAERKLRHVLPELIDQHASILWHLLDTIEQRMHNAAEIMLPALRQALQGFTKRADIIIRQLGYLTSSRDDKWVRTCDVLLKLPPEECARRLELAGNAMASAQLGLIDPAQIKLGQKRRERSVSTYIEEPEMLDSGAHRELMVQTLLDQAFLINNKTLRTYIGEALKEKNTIHTKDLPIETAQDLLHLAYIIELASTTNQSSDFRFVVKYNQQTYSNSYFDQADDFTLSLEMRHDA
ncbi:MAG TPA: Wadjet anti-phage system protein JetA family protein [Cellvibrionaceae bacterium]